MPDEFTTAALIGILEGQIKLLEQVAPRLPGAFKMTPGQRKYYIDGMQQVIERLKGETPCNSTKP